MGRLFFIFGIVSLSILALFFFPVYLETNAHYDMNGRKFSFSINAYKLIKLLGGYIATYQGGLALHVSPKKAILIPYSEMNDKRKRFSVIHTFRLKTLIVTAETGAEYLIPVALAQSVFRIYFFAMGGKKEKLENNLWLTDGDTLRVSVNFIIRFNLFIILRNFLKFLKEKIRYYVRQKSKNQSFN